MSSTKSRRQKRFYLNRVDGIDSDAFQLETLESRCLLTANLVTNGSFENPLVSATGTQAYSANSVNPLTGWTVGGGGAVATLGKLYTNGGFTFNAADGAASLNLGRSSVGQNITTDVGTSYNVTFSVGNVVDPSGLQFGTDSFVHLFINGTDVDVAANFAGGTTVNWKQFTFPFTATTTSTFIQFVSFDSGHDGYTGLDAVSVTLQGKLQFIQQPSDTAAGDTIAPPVTVAVEDASGAFTNSTDQITLRLASSANTGTLTGTLTQTAVNGIATFRDLSINDGGTYNLIAIDGSIFTPIITTPALSSPFKITGDKLVFQPAPVDGTANDPLKPIVVLLEDGQGNVETTDSSTVITLNLVGLSSANPIKNNTATVVNGRATFSNVILTKAGFYQLQATDDADDAVATSGKFKVAGDKLKLLTPPKSNDINTHIPLTVEILNSKGKLDTTVTSTLVLTLNVISGGANASLLGTTQLQFVAGKAIFNATDGPTINAAGTYTLTATEEDTSTGALAPTNTTTPLVTKPFTIPGPHLIFLPKPTDSAVNAPLTLSVAVAKSNGNVDTLNNTSTILLNFVTVTPGENAVLQGPTVVNVVNGVATWSATTNVIKFDTIGTYELTATDGTDPLITSKPFKIQGSHLVVLTKLKPADVNAPIPFTIGIADVHNNIDTSNNTTVIDISVVNAKTGQPAPFTESVTTPILSGGKITFDSVRKISIDQAGTYNITATAVHSIVLNGVVTPVGTIEPVTIKNVKVTGFHLEFAQAPPSTAAVGVPIPFAVLIKNIEKQTDDNDSSTGLEISVTDTTTGLPALFTEGGPRPVVLFGAAIFQTFPFPYISIDQPGTYTITITAIDASTAGGLNTVLTTIDPVTSKLIKVT